MNERDEHEAQAAMAALYSHLATMLTGRDSHDAEVVRVRAELARACALAGSYEDAVYQVEALVKDCRRELGEDHDSTRAALAVKQEVWGIIERAYPEDGSGDGGAGTGA